MINKTRLGVGIMGLLLLAIGAVYADDFRSAWMGEYDDDDGKYRTSSSRQSLSTVNFPLYAKECGSCHFAYQPGWLPARSWDKMMVGLNDHFGDNAELSPESTAIISQYLREGASDTKVHRKSQKLMRGIGDSAPLRISTLPYIRSKHDEIPARLITGNSKVGSLANCAACHTQAADGNFGEHGVRIPKYGRWED